VARRAGRVKAALPEPPCGWVVEPPPPEPGAGSSGPQGGGKLAVPRTVQGPRAGEMERGGGLGDWDGRAEGPEDGRHGRPEASARTPGLIECSGGDGVEAERREGGSSSAERLRGADLRRDGASSCGHRDMKVGRCQRTPEAPLCRLPSPRELRRRRYSGEWWAGAPRVAPAQYSARRCGGDCVSNVGRRVELGMRVDLEGKAAG